VSLVPLHRFLAEITSVGLQFRYFTGP
jgi:hypothetical protein